MKKIIFILLASISVSSLYASMAIAKYNINIREEPSIKSSIIGSIPRGSDIEVLTVVGDGEGAWCEVFSGYVSCALLDMEPEDYISENLLGIEEFSQEPSISLPKKHLEVIEDERSENNYKLILNQEDIDKLTLFFNKSESKNFQTFSINLETLVQECVKRNSNVLLQRIQTDIGVNKIKYEEGILDPILTLSASKSQAHVPNDAIDSTIQQSSEYEDDVILYNAGVSGMLSPGTKWELSFNEQSKWSTYIENKYPREHSNKIDLNIRQPLLKGFGSDNTLVKINIAKIDSLVARSEYTKNTMDLVGTVIQLYWKLYGSYKLYLSWEHSLNIANDQLVNIKQSLEYGKRSKFELYSAEKSVSLRKVELYNTKTAIFEIQNKILNLLSLSSSKNEDILLIPIDDAAIDKIEIPELQDSYEKSIANWPELQILKDKLQVSKLKVDYSKDQLDPQLDFTINVNKSSLNTDGQEARQNLVDKDFLSWSSGLEFSIPIYNDYAEQNYEIEKLKYIQSSVELNQIRRTLNNGIHSKIMNLKNNKISFAEYLHGITFQNKLVNMEYQRLELGKSSIVEVFEQQENLIKYERKMFNNIIELKLAEAALQKASGVLLERFNIELYDKRKYEIAKDARYEVQ